MSEKFDDVVQTIDKRINLLEENLYEIDVEVSEISKRLCSGQEKDLARTVKSLLMERDRGRLEKILENRRAISSLINELVCIRKSIVEGLYGEKGILKVRIKELDRQIEVAESEVERLDDKRNGLEIRLEDLERLLLNDILNGVDDNEGSN